MMFVAQTTTAKRNQAIRRERAEKKVVACEHDQHLNATDGTVRCSECIHTQKCYCNVCQLLPFFLSIIFQSECIYCARLYHTHTHTFTRYAVCLILIWRTKCLLKITIGRNIEFFLCNRAYSTTTW